MWSGIESLVRWYGRPFSVSTRFFWWFLAGIEVLALSIRLFLWYMEPTIARDGVFYLKCAERLAGISGEAVPDNFFTPLLWSGILAVFLRSGWNAELCGIGLNLLAGVLLPLVVCRGMLELKQSRAAALAAAALTAVHPFAAAASVELLRESLYLLFCAVAVVMALHAMRPERSIWWWGGAGAVSGLAVMMRFEAVEFIPLVLGGGLFCLCLGIGKWRRNLAVLSLYGSGMLLCCLIVLYCLNVSLPGFDVSPADCLIWGWLKIRFYLG